VVDYTEIVKQAATGFASTPLAIPALGGLAYGWATGDENNAASRFSSEYAEKIRNAIGAKPFNEASFGERVANVAGTVGFPTPLAAAKIAGYAPQITSTAGKIAGRFADWFVFPGSNPYTKANVAVNVGVGTGLNEAIRATQMDDDPASLSVGTDSASPLGLDLSGATPIKGPLGLDLSDAVSVQAPEAVDSLGLDLSDALPIEPIPFEDNDEWSMSAAAIGGAVVLPLMLIAAKRFAAPSKRLATVDLGPESTKKLRPVAPSATVKEKVITNNLDPLYGPASTLRRAGIVDDKVDDWLNQVSGTTRQGGVTTARHLMTTGEFPTSSNLKTYPLTALKEEFGTLDPARAKMLNEGMIYRDLIESNDLPKGIEMADATATIKSMLADPQLKLMADKYTHIGKKIWRYLKDMDYIDNELYQAYRYRNYVPSISLDEGSGIWHVNMGKKALNLLGLDDARNLQLRDFQFISKRLQPTGQAINPFDAMEEYTTAMITMAQKNQVQRQWIDMMKPAYKERLAIAATMPKTRKSFKSKKAFEEYSKDFIKSRSTNPKVDPSVYRSISKQPVKTFTDPKSVGQYMKRDDHIVIRRNGKFEAWKFGDPFLAQAMKLAPYGTHKIIGSFRRVFQQATTGTLAPWFAVKSLIWGTSLGSIARQPGHTFGMLDEAAQRLSGGSLAVRGDPTAILNTFAGVGSGLTSQLKLELAQSFKNLTHTNSTFMRSLPDDVQTSLADSATKGYMVALQAYKASPKGIAEKWGALNSGPRFDPSEQYSQLTKSLTPNFNSRSLPGAVWHYYKTVLESLHNGPRIGFISQNISRFAKQYGSVDAIPEKVMRKLMKDARELEGDFTRSGIGKGHRLATEAVPYYNVTIQTMGRLGEAMARDPHFGASIGAGIIASAVIPTVIGDIMMSIAGEDHRKFLWNDLQPWERATHAILPTPDLAKTAETGTMQWMSPEHSLKVPIAPESWIPATIMRHVIADNFGLKDGSIVNPAHRDILEAFAGYFGLPLPPAIQAAFNAGGYRLEPGLDPEDKGSILGVHAREILADRTAGAVGGDKRYPSSVFSANVEEMLTSLFGTAMRIGLSGLASANAQDGIGESLSAFGEEFGFEVKRRVPIAAPLFGIHVASTNTVVAQQRRRKIDAAQNIFSQMSVERGGRKANLRGPLANVGQGGPTMLTDPKAIQVTTTVYNLLGRDPYLNNLNTIRNKLRSQIQIINGDRGQTWKPQERNAKMNLLKAQLLKTELGLFNRIKDAEQAIGMSMEDAEKLVMGN
jgi:hypothetical protein